MSEDIKNDIYIEIPIGMELETEDRKTTVLKLQKLLHRLKTAGKTRFDYLKDGLIKREFKLSEIDLCVFVNNDSVLLVYIDDLIIISKKKANIDSFVTSLKNGFKNYVQNISF